jgi:cyclopropane-fatty-acyl-phospholipid synthase
VHSHSDSIIEANTPTGSPAPDAPLSGEVTREEAVRAGAIDPALIAAGLRRLTQNSNVVLPAFRIVPFEGSAVDVGDGPPAFRVIERTRGALRSLVAMDGLAVGEAYMAGELDIDGDLIAATRYQEVFGDNHPALQIWRRLHPILVGRERVNPGWIAHHYDAANAQLYAADRDYNTYTPGIYRSDADSLEVGAERKLAAAFEHLGLKAGDHLLEVGSGWGGMVRYAARRGVRVTGVTLSRDQKAHVDALIAREKLPAEVRYQDFFTFEPGHKFDAVSMMGVIEDLSDYRRVMRKLHDLVKPGRRVYLDFGAERQRFGTHSFVTRYVWPGTFRMVFMPEFVEAVRESPFELQWLENDRSNYHVWCVRLYKRWQEARPEVVAKHGERVWRMFALLYAGVAAMMDRRSHSATAYRVVLELPADNDGTWWTPPKVAVTDQTRGLLRVARETALGAWRRFSGQQAMGPEKP